MAVPNELVKISEKAIRHPEITKAGITKTAEGKYALLATVRKNTSTPVNEIEELAQGFPVVYQQEEDSLPVAWPARPGRE